MTIVRGEKKSSQAKMDSGKQKCDELDRPDES